MYRGHDPAAIRDYAWRDIECYLAVAGLLDARGGIGELEME
jgi:hypothetical protein